MVVNSLVQGDSDQKELLNELQKKTRSTLI